MNVNSEERIGRAIQVIGMALGCMLIGHGWTLRSEVGKPLVLVRGEEAFDPFRTVKALADGGGTREQWQEMCESMGLSDGSLAPALDAATVL